MRTDGDEKAEAFEVLGPLYLSPDPVMGVRDFQLLFPTDKQKDEEEETQEAENNADEQVDQEPVEE